MRVSIIFLSIFISAVVAGITGFVIATLPKQSITIFEPDPTPIPTPLSKYQIENLKEADIPKGELKITETIAEEEKFTSYVFEHQFDPTLENKAQKVVTGQINIPKEEGEYPLIIMMRGYVDQTIFETGIGTRPSARFYAENGFITVAPDFLGYGGSSSESGNIFETRFQTYTTVMSILNMFDEEFAKQTQDTIKWDGKHIFFWGHSNGGQIALTVLSATGREIPTTLWAPVTKPFPYSILYYTDESADGGKFIRRELAQFEEAYDVDMFSFTNYLEEINAPLQIHQGGVDDAIPTEWTNSFVARMRRLEKEVEYFFYPSADHNMRPDWDTVVARDVDFFRKYIQN